MFIIIRNFNEKSIGLKIQNSDNLLKVNVYYLELKTEQHLIKNIKQNKIETVRKVKFII